MSKIGFELNINGAKYLVIARTTEITKTSVKSYSNRCSILLDVWRNDERVSLDKNEYVAEKIGDFIKNCINGQDSCYWDFNKPNRHDRKVGD
jgi:hypothetical protein